MTLVMNLLHKLYKEKLMDLILRESRLIDYFITLFYYFLMGYDLLYRSATTRVRCKQTLIYFVILSSEITKRIK